MSAKKGIPCSVVALFSLLVVVVGVIAYLNDFPLPMIRVTSIVLAIIAAIIFLIYKRPYGKEHDNALEHIGEDSPNSNSIILTQNMNETEVINAINSFNKMCKENDEHFKYFSPEIKRIGNNFLLFFDRSINYRDFCFWLNYLVYSDKNKRHNNDITGWYEVGSTTNNHPLSNKLLMLFIPESDNEFDNVYLVDNFNNCYKQEFSFDENIIPLNESIIKYKEKPDLWPD